MSASTLILLVGPKGAGKSTIGRMIEAELGARFVEVEAIAKAVLAQSGGTIDEGYARRAFAAIVAHLATLAPAHPLLVIETTGASSGTAELLAALRAQHTVRIVRVDARADLCDARIASRDAARHVAVPAGLVREMYLRSTSLELPWDLVLDNNGPLTAAEVARAVAPLIPPLLPRA
jgi:shikimate kinase